MDQNQILFSEKVKTLAARIRNQSTVVLTKGINSRNLAAQLCVRPSVEGRHTVWIYGENNERSHWLDERRVQ